MKHEGYTPGPWRYTSDGRVYGCCAHEWNASLNMSTAPFVAAGTHSKEDLALIADAPRLAEENERLREALRKLINAAELEGFTEERSDDPLSIAKAALAGREEEK
jgi:hypothetical protein